MKVALYARVSSEEQAENHSIEAQIDHLKNFAKINNYKYDIYIDAGYSGTVDDRPEFRKMIQDAHQGKFKQIIVYRIDRLFRSTRQLLNLVYDLEILEVSVRSTTEPFDTGSPMGKFMMQLIASIAELERNVFLERADMGRKQRLKKGMHWGTPPYGYNCNKKTGKLEINEEEAEVVKTIFDIYVNPSSSSIKVADYLNSKGILTKKLNSWDASAVSDIIRKTCYVGYVEYNKYTGGKGSNIKPKEEWIKGECPQIVSKETYQKAQEMADRRRAYKLGGNAKHNYLLKEMLFCGNCESRLGGTTETSYTGKDKKYGPYYYRKYRCMGRSLDYRRKDKLDLKRNCKMKQIDAEEVEEEVWNTIKEVLIDPGIMEEALQSEGNDSNEELEKINKNIELIKNERKKILTAYQKELITEEDLKDQLNDINEREQKMISERSYYDSILSKQEQDALIIGSITELSLLVKDKLDEFDFEQRRDLVCKMVDRVVLGMDGKLDIKFSFFWDTIPPRTT